MPPPDPPFQSKYCYPGTETLRNHFGIRDPYELHVAERVVVDHALADLKREPVHGNFDLLHLSAIHHTIFRDVYPWAGEVRSEQIAKGETVFTPCEIIIPLSAQLFASLHAANNLQGMNAPEFVENAANLYLAINAIHPFPEGNGRTQREFIRTLGLNAGYQLDWSRVERKDLLEATLASTYKPGDLALPGQLDRTLVNRQPNLTIQRSYRELAFERDYER